MSVCVRSLVLPAPADTDILAAYRRILRRDARPAFLLESAHAAGGGGAVAAAQAGLAPCRWSLAGGRPAAVLTARRGDGVFALRLTTYRRPGGEEPATPEVRAWAGDPFAALRELQGAYAEGACAPAGPPADDAPPLRGGLVGYFGYACAHAVESLPAASPDLLGLPDLAFLVADEVVAHDAASGRIHLSVTGRGPTPAAAAGDADLRLADLQRAVPRPLEGQAPSRPASLAGQGLSLQGVQATFSAEDYRAAVGRCREAILAGRVFEVCLTQGMRMDLPGTGWDLYAILRRINPAPFAAYLRFDGLEIAGASPERFLHLGPDRTAESRPIKGTRPRGADPAHDERLRRELAASAKDRAENVMIVDLTRSDLGRVCTVGSVRVPRLCAVETYATVHQLVSTVQGVLRPGLDALDLVQACFPGGSMTGAPKIEAMKLIDEIEPAARGVYAGALGYWDRGGGMDLAMVIRTVVCKDGCAHFGVGGAVTAESDPAAEYAETLDKARALIAAVRLLGGPRRR